MAIHPPTFSLWRGLSLFLILFLAACSPAPQQPAAPASTPLLVAAAANVQLAFTEIAQKFTARSGQAVEFSFGSSGNLASQIENGAPFDLFVAANVAFVDRLNEQGLIFPETQQLYAQGRIVLAVNRESGLQVTNLEDLLDPAIRWVAIANPELAPYGQAAKEALQSAGIWDELQPKLVLAENIGQTLQYVQTGDAAVGITALALADVPEVSYTLLPVELHQPLNQAMAVIRTSKNEAAARAFLEFVTGPEGQAILEKYGFQSPRTT